MISKKLRISLLILTFSLLALIGTIKLRADFLEDKEREAAIAELRPVRDVWHENVKAIEAALRQHPTASKLPDPYVIAGLIYDLSNQFKDEGITVPIILGLIETESGFNVMAVCVATPNPSSYGLTQLTMDTARPYLRYSGLKATKANLFDPVTNLSIGVEVLADNVRKMRVRNIPRDLVMDYAFGVYNMGESGFFKHMDGNRPGGVARKYIALQHKHQQNWSSLR